MATNVYVDGPNLYYAALRDRPVRWLDLTTWGEQLLPDHDVRRVRYFTAWAHPSREGQQVNRQQVYIRALREQRRRVAARSAGLGARRRDVRRPRPIPRAEAVVRDGPRRR